MFLAREVAGLSSSAVGQELGGRHHTTVLHGQDFISSEARSDTVLRNQLQQLESLLING
jgi:chromosomal replication initiation ATPase DnaA